jgi:hypothetical protein
MYPLNVLSIAPGVTVRVSYIGKGPSWNRSDITREEQFKIGIPPDETDRYRDDEESLKTSSTVMISRQWWMVSASGK